MSMGQDSVDGCLPREFELLPQLVKRFITPQKPGYAFFIRRPLPSPTFCTRYQTRKTTRKILAKVRLLLDAEILGQFRAARRLSSPLKKQDVELGREYRPTQKKFADRGKTSIEKSRSKSIQCSILCRKYCIYLMRIPTKFFSLLSLYSN